MDEEKKEMNVSKYVVPVVVVAVFALLLFGAGYAYFAANVNIDNNVTNINATLPAGSTAIHSTSNTCTISPSATGDGLIEAGEMTQGTADNTTPKALSSCYLNVILNGAAGVKCTYDVILNETSTNAYVPTTGVGAGDIPYEFTGTLVSTSTDTSGSNAIVFGSTTAGGTAISNGTTGVETQMDTLVGTLYTDATTSGAGLIAKGTIEIPASGADVTQTITLTEKWYNIPLDQATHSAKSYSFVMSARNVVC